MKYWLGVEIGGTKQQLGVVDDGGNLIETVSERIALPRGADDILDWMKAKIPPLLARYDVAGIGVGFGGVLRTALGASICSVHVPGWKDFPLRDWFRERFDRPATVVNDTVCGGYAELLYGTGKGLGAFAYTNIGTGCGGALFYGGRTFDGVGVGGAYFGQTYVPDRHTGRTVRMENVCSGTAVNARLRTPGTIPPESALYPLRADCSFKELCAAARSGDAFALREIDAWAESYSYAMANILTICAVSRIALGGGAANDADLLIPLVRDYTEKIVFLSARGRYDIVACRFLDDAVILGAALYARDGFHSLPTETPDH